MLISLISLSPTPVKDTAKKRKARRRKLTSALTPQPMRHAIDSQIGHFPPRGPRAYGLIADGDGVEICGGKCYFVAGDGGEGGFDARGGGIDVVFGGEDCDGVGRDEGFEGE